MAESQSNSNKKQTYIILIVIAALLIALAWYNKSEKSEPNTTQTPTGQNSNQTPSTITPATPTPAEEVGAIESRGNELTITGLVVPSDNAARGKYMVQTGSSNIYLAGSRDYGQYNGKKVQVNATGTIEGFSIVSVEVLE